MYKTHKIVILPTNEKSHIYLISKTNKLGYITGKIESDLEQFPNQKETINQHLYIISDGIIEEGDWCLDEERNIILFKHFNSGVLHSDNHGQLESKKIIATINSSLSQFGIMCAYKKVVIPCITIPQIPQQFIKHYITKYNEGNVINELLINYEGSCLLIIENIENIKK